MAAGFVISTPFCRLFSGSSVLRNVRWGQIEPLRRNCFLRLNTEFQSFIADACGFLNRDVIWSLEKGYWRINGNHRCFLAAQRKRKVKSSTAIGQAAIPNVANGRFIIVQAVSSLGVPDALRSPHTFQG